jgi:hypothetical protein
LKDPRDRRGRIEYFQSFPALPIETLKRPHELAPFAKRSVRMSLKLRIIGAPVYSGWTMYVKRKCRIRLAGPAVGLASRICRSQNPLGNRVLTMVSVWLGA